MFSESYINMPELSIILATVNDSIACNLTCAHILEQLERDEIDYEILLIDNNSLPEEKALLEQFLRYHNNFPIKYLNFDIQGTIPIHAYGVEQAQGKYITMPEPHIVLSPHYYRDLLESAKLLKQINCEIVFGSFVTGSITHRGDSVLKGSTLIKRNPFARTTGGGGEECHITDHSEPIFAGAFCGMVCEKDWMLKIGNMFPDAFKTTGGYIAESVMIGLLTWMFGKKCYVVPQALLQHPVYRIRKGPGRNEGMFASMATAAYITGGEKYLNQLPEEFGAYEKDFFESVIKDSQYAREFVEKNAIFTLDEFLKDWKYIKDA